MDTIYGQYGKCASALSGQHDGASEGRNAVALRQRPPCPRRPRMPLAGRTLASIAGDEDVVRLWDVSDPAEPAVTGTLPDPVVYGMAFSPDGVVFADIDPGGLVKLWIVTDPA